MADVIITPAAGLIDFQNTSGISSATIQLNGNGDLIIGAAAGDIQIGDTSSDIFVGDGVNNVDIVFEQDGEVRGETGVTVTLGQSDSYIKINAGLKDSTNGVVGAAGSVLSSDGSLVQWVPAQSGAQGTTGTQGTTGIQGIQGITGSLSTWSRKTGNYTASNGDRLIADTSGGAFTITLPASPSTGNSVIIADGADWETTNLTVARNGSTIEGNSDDVLLDIKGAIVELIYDGTTWEVYSSVGQKGTSAVSNWVIKNTNYTASVDDKIIADTSGGTFTITLPASPSAGDGLRIADGSNWYTNNLTVARNGSTIEGLSENLTVDVGRSTIDLIYSGSTWKVYSNNGPQGIQGPTGPQGITGTQGIQGGNARGLAILAYLSPG